MFVTSDIFDLEAIGRFRDFTWRENLLGGVNVLGTDWPGYQTAARFLLAAAQGCGLDPEMDLAGYNVAGQWRTREITRKSFDRLARGDLRGALQSVSVLLRGQRPAAGAEDGSILFGGTAGSIRQRRGPTGPIPLAGPPWRFRANFVFPLDSDPVKTAGDLLRLSVSLLGAEYGYYFVRDSLCAPEAYNSGMSAPLDWGRLSMHDAEEVGNWCDFVTDGRWWSGDWPKFRDLFEVNLISKRHTSVRMGELGYLTDWITAKPGRGRLEDAGQDRWLWILTDQEVFNVRPLLNEAGLLLTCRPRVYRDVRQTR